MIAALETATSGRMDNVAGHDGPTRNADCHHAQDHEPDRAASLIHPIRAGVDLNAAEQAVRLLLAALGEDPQREGLRDTPRRMARAMAALTAGRFEDPAVHLSRQFTQHCDEVVILRDIEFFSLCEHHLLPFIGKAHVAYLPSNGKVVGLSKLARVVDVFARRPQLQEQMTNQIADALALHAEARGVAVVVEAEHMCMKMRGACKHEAAMQTFALRGELREDPHMRAEILGLLTRRSL